MAERGRLVVTRRVLGRVLRVTAEPGLSVELAAEGEEADEARGPAEAADVEVALVRSPARERPGSVREGAPVVVHEVTLAVRHVDDGGEGSWEVGDEAVGGRIRLAPGGVHVVAWDASGRWESVPSMAVLRLLGMEALRARGLVPLHAAVIAHGDEAVALLGPSGAGKSTTLLRALREGWQPVSEDLAWVDPGSCRVARGDHGVRVWPEARDRYVPWLTSLPWQPDFDGKTLLPYEELGGAVAPEVRLARVAVLSPPGAEGGSEPLPAREVARALWEAAGWPLVPATQRALGAHVAALAGRVRGERLVLGDLPQPPVRGGGAAQPAG